MKRTFPARENFSTRLPLIAVAFCAAGFLFVDGAFAAEPVAAPLRLAVIPGEGETAPDAAAFGLIEKNLLEMPDVAWVERERVSAALKELALAASLDVSQRTLKLGRVLNADGLLFVNADADFLHVILVETRHGRRLFDMVRNRPDASPEVTSRLARELIIKTLPRLAASGREGHTLCVVPLELADVPANLPGGPAHWESLRIMTGLIAARLASTPGIVVLERSQLRDVLGESCAAGAESNELSAAAAVLQGCVAYLGENPERRFGFAMCFKPLGAKDGTSADFKTVEAGFPFCADAIAAWVVGLVGVQQKPDPFALAQEASMHYANGRLFQSRGRIDPLPSFETAYLLQPTNRQYASAFLALLLERNQHEATLDEELRGVAVPLEKQLERFSLAMDLSRLLDPDAKSPCVSLPAFMLSVPTNSATICRIAILPTRDTRAPRTDEGGKAARRLLGLIAEDSAFQVADEKKVQDAIRELHLDGADLLYTGTNVLTEIANHLGVDTVVASSIYGDEPRLQLRFLVVAGGPTLTGSCTGTGQPDREPLVGSVRELVYIIRDRHHRMGTALTSQEKERYLACRKQAESYYKWYKGH